MGTLSETYHVRGDLSQNQHLDGMPLGTVGGTRVNHFFPRDGEYVFQTRLFRTNFDNPRGIEYPHEFELTVDGERVHHATIGGPADLAAAFERPKETADAIDERLGVRVRVSAGPHDVVAAFIGSAPTVDTHEAPPVSQERLRYARLDGPASHPDADDHRAVQRDGTGRHAGAAANLHLSPGQRGDGRRLREADHRDAGSARVPGAGQRDGLCSRC